MNNIAFAAAFLVTLSVFFLQQAIDKPSFETALVTRVIDGDTFEIEGGGVVRILGINTPEKKQPFYGNASFFLKDLIEGRNVTMEKDTAETDKYGRHLRYVFIGGIFVNEEILREGFANVYIIPPNEKYSARLEKAEQYARKTMKGLWNASTYSSCFVVSELHWDAFGNDNENLNDEFVSLNNICNTAINMTGWTLKNAGTKTYKFGKVFLGPIQGVTIRSGCGKNSGTELFWCSRKPVWNNNGDAVYLRDAEGLLVFSEAYAGKAE